MKSSVKKKDVINQVVPVQLAVESEWFSKAPTKPGLYWFHGEPSMGSMGGHYNGTVKPEKQLHLVSVRKISNGMMFVANGQFMPSLEWDGGESKKEGWLGRWAQCIVPDVDLDDVEKTERELT